jgi:hypothetical protein
LTTAAVTVSGVDWNAFTRMRMPWPAGRWFVTGTVAKVLPSVPGYRETCPEWWSVGPRPSGASACSERGVKISALLCISDDL